MENYESMSTRVKVQAIIMCSCVSCIGIIIGTMVGVFFQDYIICTYISSTCDENIKNLINLTNQTSNIVPYNQTSNIVQYNQTYVNSTFLYSIQSILSPISSTKVTQSVISVGTSIAVSIGAVFAFVGCVFSSAWYVKNKPNALKTYITEMTKSQPIQLTKEEISENHINPLMSIYDESNNKLLASAIRNITNAINKDKDHDYHEALKLYNKGIDQFILYMKKIINTDERFALAKKIDMYMIRAKHLQICIENQTLMNEVIPSVPQLKNY